MRKFLLAAVVLVVVPYVPVAEAGFVNGNTLLTRCRNETDVYEGRALDIVVSWLEAHSRRRHLAANGLVAAALSEAFPCKN